MARLSNEQKKSLLTQKNYCLRLGSGQKLYGRLIGFDTDSYRRFGAVVVFPNGTRTFWGVNDNTLQVYDMGFPPSKPRAFVR